MPDVTYRCHHSLPLRHIRATLQMQNQLCPPCYASQRGVLGLVGTPAQVEWATGIRQHVLESLRREVTRLSGNRALDAALANGLARHIPSAAWWIDHREFPGTRDWVQRLGADAVSQRAVSEDCRRLRRMSVTVRGS